MQRLRACQEKLFQERKDIRRSEKRVFEAMGTQRFYVGVTIRMVELMKSVDFCARRAKRIERGNDELLSEVLSILDACSSFRDIIRVERGTS